VTETEYVCPNCGNTSTTSLGLALAFVTRSNKNNMHINPEIFLLITPLPEVKDKTTIKQLYF
jgi:hypothetical protein